MLKYLLVYTAIVFCASITFAVLQRQDRKINSNQIHNRHSSAPQTCGFTGNSDIYGLGIRLGIYLQWIAALISKRYLVSSRSEILRELLDVNTIFSLAIFIATVILPTEAQGVEVLIMLHFYFGNTYIISYEQLLRGRHAQGLTFFGTLATISITTGMSAYAIYYWFHGLDLLSGTGCGSFAFLFAKVRLEGRARTFFKLAAVVNMIVWGTGFLLLSCYAVPWLLAGLFGITVHNTKYGLKKLFSMILNKDVEIEAPWRRTSRGHSRYILGLYMGKLGAPKPERERQPGWPADADEGKGRLMSGSQHDNPVV
ncbi:MAG: hypothetical protein Q9164_002270 [Protoblastenia rupestris]